MNYVNILNNSQEVISPYLEYIKTANLDLPKQQHLLAVNPVQIRKNSLRKKILKKV